MTKDNWREIVAEGKELATLDRGEARFKLGDLALQVAPMGEGHGRTGSMETLSEYAEEIGVGFKTLILYRSVAEAWPDTTRVVSASWTLHRAFMAQPDRADLIQAAWTPKQVRELLAERRPKTVGISRNDKWWVAEKTALQQLRKWDEKKLAGISAAEAARRAEVIEEMVGIEEQIIEQLKARSYTRSL